MQSRQPLTTDKAVDDQGTKHGRINQVVIPVQLRSMLISPPKSQSNEDALDADAGNAYAKQLISDIIVGSWRKAFDVLHG